MEEKNCTSLALALDTFVVFEKLLENSVISNLNALIHLETSSTQEVLKHYAKFVARLYEAAPDGNLTTYIWSKLIEDDNLYIRSGGQVSEWVRAASEHELECLEQLAQMTPEIIQSAFKYSGFLPRWTVSDLLLKQLYVSRAKKVSALGYGMYATHHMFVVKSGGMVPVQVPDPITLDELKGYEDARRQVIENTRALIEGRSAANVLLYGDAGTGKSSTIKAVTNAYANEGLRLIEIPKREMNAIPTLTEMLSDNPLKFIFFIDDLSFTSEGDDLSALKTILEGSVSAKTPNIAIYATSNRRHLVKEHFSERGNDDVHANETIQEKVSLSGRFGLTVHFGKPDQEKYLEIVKHLTNRHGLSLEESELRIQAERFALERGGRSPRLAKQFVESLLSKQA